MKVAEPAQTATGEPPAGRAERPTLARIIETVLACDPSATAMEQGGRPCGWGELGIAIADLRQAFEAMVPSGARIGVLLRNRPAQAAAALAVLCAEHCLVTLNPAYPDAVLAADIAGLDLALLLGEAADLARPGVMDAARASGAGVIELGARPGMPSHVVTPVSRSIAGASDAAIEMLSSGTTGKPKRIPLERRRFQRALVPAIDQEASEQGRLVFRVRSGCRVMTAPLTHIGGIWGLLRAVIAGRRLVLLEKFRLSEWLEAVRRHRPVSVAVAPAGLRMILDAQVPGVDLDGLKAITAGTAPTDPALIDAFWERYRIPVLVNYGATEFGGPVANWSLADFHAYREAKRGSVGRLYPGVEARAVDPDTGTPLPLGAEGLIELKGRQFSNPDQWLRTTDRGRVDADGFLWITGRADAAIIRGGFKVHPEDVIAALEAHSDIREAAVVGIEDGRLGQVPAAMIVLRDGADFDEPALRAHLRERLLPYQLPTRIVAAEDLPRTASMKPALAEIRRLLSHMD